MRRSFNELNKEIEDLKTKEYEEKLNQEDSHCWSCMSVIESGDLLPDFEEHGLCKSCHKEMFDD